jgi:hypothetical protein
MLFLGHEVGEILGHKVGFCFLQILTEKRGQHNLGSFFKKLSL